MTKTALPEGAEKYATTPTFTTETVPSKLTGEHNTKAGVWGRLCVVQGALDYVLDDGSGERRHIAAGATTIIEPQVIHHVELEADTSFYVEFYKVG